MTTKIIVLVLASLLGMIRIGLVVAKIAMGMYPHVRTITARNDGEDAVQFIFFLAVVVMLFFMMD